MKLSDLPSNSTSLDSLVNTQSPIPPSLKDQSQFLESVTIADASEQVPLPIQETTNPIKTGAWGVFSSTFLTIFLAEMGDKTQLATLLMSAESQSPWVVFAGAGLALISTSLVGVLLGRFLASKVSPKTLDSLAGITLLVISVMLWWEVLRF